MLRIAVDTGGTFTDFVFQDLASGAKTFWKTLSTPAEPDRAVREGLAHLFGTLGAEPGQVREILVATTVATNAIIERKGAVTGLVTTEGFRDVLIIGRQKRHDNYDLFLDKPVPLVPRRRIVEVAERMTHEGAVERPLELDSVERAIAVLLGQGVESIAVSLLHAYASPVHERAIGEHLRSRAPGVAVSLSCEVSPKYREYERTSTTVANAYVKPIVEHYLGRLQETFAERGLQAQLYVMQSSGGLMTPDLARKYPVNIVESGPAAGVLMCSLVGAREGFSEVLTFDMGGTTAKVGAIEGGEPAITPTIEVDGVNLRKYSGLPLNIPSIEMIEIGAGGGSVATTAMGLIRVGPESAGADPGPMCYGRGGERATLTDANLVLGYLNVHNFAGGSIALDAEAAARGIRAQIAAPLGLGEVEAAWGVHAVANAAMERAMRTMSMERGRDPRHYALVAFGGAGPLHAARLARVLGIPRVIVPWGAGVGSAVGLLDADPRFSAAQTRLLRIAPDNVREIAGIYRELEQRVLHEAAHIQQAPRVVWKRFAYLRYVGQGYEVRIDLLPDSRIDAAFVERALDAFHEAYRTAYGYNQPENAVEATDWYLTATVPTGISRVEPQQDAPGKPARRARVRRGFSTRPAYFHDAGAMIDCQVVDRYQLRPGDRIEGPAVIEEREATTVVLPGDRADVRPSLNLILTVGVPQ
jgi:N-methylhydantoinase A